MDGLNNNFYNPFPSPATAPDVPILFLIVPTSEKSVFNYPVFLYINEPTYSALSLFGVKYVL